MVTATEQDGIKIVSVTSPAVDASNYKEVRGAIDGAIAGSEKVILDLSGVEFMDSSALGSLISVFRSLTGRGAELRLCGLQSRVQMLFELTRLYRVFSIWPDQAAAVASLNQAAGA